MYFATNLYSAEAWEAWKNGAGVNREHCHPTTDYVQLQEDRSDWFKKITFEPVDTFAKLLERINFLQLMNKRHVLYFRGQSADYGLSYGHTRMDFPSLLRPLANCRYLDIDLFEQRWHDLNLQSIQWRMMLTNGHHPRLRTMEYFPEAIWAVQQHYKDVLGDPNGVNQPNAAGSILTDVTQSIRTAAIFALGGRHTSPAPYISVVALPQTTGSITYDADQQLSIMRLSALCPPAALRPQLQEGLLVGRFPFVIKHLKSLVTSQSVIKLEEFYSLRRRMVAVIPLEINENFWEGHGRLEETHMLSCPWFDATVKPNWQVM